MIKNEQKNKNYIKNITRKKNQKIGNKIPIY